MPADPSETSGQGLGVGDLAALTGVTVRTLHHYDEIGLLTPSHRTASGHRRYGPAEIDRLQRIVALRSLGLSLADVTASLDRPDGATGPVARRQLEDVRARIAELRRLERRLLDHLDAIDQRSTCPPTTDALELTAMTIRLDRITTRTGDDGTTSLADGTRRDKTDARIEAIGTVDELDAVVGLAVDAVTDPVLTEALIEVQQQLFDLGADLASPEAPATGRHVGADAVERLEAIVAESNEVLAPLDSFVLPGGSGGAGELHLARTVCRRAERRVLAVEGDIGVADRYLNRLSDVLFVLARRAAGGRERTWDQRRSSAS
jgi:cob(I)alamin adenosyltransferase